MSDDKTPHQVYRGWIYEIARRVINGYRPAYGEEQIWREAAEIERKENPKKYAELLPIKQSA